MNPTQLAEQLSNRNLIDGQSVPAISGRTFDVINPATMQVIGAAPFSEQADVDAAVAAAEARGSPGEHPATERGRMITECGRILDDHSEETRSSSPWRPARPSDCRVERSCREARVSWRSGQNLGETIPYKAGMIPMTIREPLGVVGAIIPWNVPAYPMGLKIAQALVAGNTIVLKSAEEALLCILRAVELMHEGLPPGTESVRRLWSRVGADRLPRGRARCPSPARSRRASPSTPTPRAPAPVVLELGGKSPMIVYEDADLDAAVAGAVTGMRFTRQGQSCSASSRMFVHESLHDEFIERMAAAVDAMVMGDPSTRPRTSARSFHPSSSRPSAGTSKWRRLFRTPRREWCAADR